MSLAYFPLYADRYEADTAHLSMLEDGAYNRLLRLCWRSPGCKLPNDLPWIFRQMRAVSDEDRAAVLAVLSEFFTKGRGKIWSEKLLKVHMQVSVAHQSKSDAGKKGAAAKALKTNKSEASTAKAQLKQPLSNKEPEPEPDIEHKGGGGSACATEAEISSVQEPTTRERILAAMGVGPDGVAGPSKFIGGQGDMAEARRWLDMPGMTVSVIEAEIVTVMSKRNSPPSTFSYFTPAMQRLSASLSSPALQPTGGQSTRLAPPKSNLEAIAAKMQAEFAARDAAE